MGKSHRMTCPQKIGGRPRPSLESDVAAPILEVNISTVAGSSVGSSATDAGVDTAVSFTPRRGSINKRSLCHGDHRRNQRTPNIDIGA